MPPSYPQTSGGPQNKTYSEGHGEQTAPQPMEGLKTLFGAMNTLRQDTGFNELASVMKEVETLREDVVSKEAAIKQLEMSREDDQKRHDSTIESFIDQHHKHCARLEGDRERLLNETTAMTETMQKSDDSRKVLEDQRAQMQDEVDRLNKELESSIALGREERQKYFKLDRDLNAANDEIEQLKAKSEKRDIEINKLKASKQSLEKNHDDMRQSLQTSENELESIRGLAVKLTKEHLTTTKERMENLWREALFLVKKHFRFSLPEASEQNIEFLENLRDVSSRAYVSTQVVPLPRRDSVSAKNMRCALVLARLMRLLDSELFQPNYIVPKESGIRGDLIREAESDSRSEAFRRAFLLSVLPEKQTRVLDERAASVFNNIMGLVEDIITDDQANDLRLDLQRFIKQACTIWQEIQRLQDKFEPSMRYAVDDSLDWWKLPFEHSEGSNNDGVSVSSGVSDATASNTSDQAVLVVFPRMYLVKDAEPKPVTPGIVLMESQTRTAAQEVASEAPKSPPFGRGSLNLSRDGRRRDSLIMDNSMANRNAGTFLGQGAPNGPSR